MEETNEILLTEGYHSITGRDVNLKIHPDADPGSSKPQSPSVKGIGQNWPEIKQNILTAFFYRQMQKKSAWII